MKITIINLFKAISSNENGKIFAPHGIWKIGNANNQLTDGGGSVILIKGIDILQGGCFVKNLSAAVQPYPVR
jgi:hypothetical protein